MNEYIIGKWNLVVKSDDIVYYLGNAGFGSDEEINEKISKK